jgi:hypothetical protein
MLEVVSSAPEAFIECFRKQLIQPIILSPPRLRKSRATCRREHTDEELVPKRSARLAAKSRFRSAKPEAQARKVMMKRMGLLVDTVKPDRASFDEFHEAFKLPLDPDTREAMLALFPDGQAGETAVISVV